MAWPDTKRKLHQLETIINDVFNRRDGTTTSLVSAAVAAQHIVDSSSRNSSRDGRGIGRRPWSQDMAAHPDRHRREGGRQSRPRHVPASPGLPERALSAHVLR